jgi:hypothetical protein
MSEKFKRIKLSDQHYLEGGPFDWTLITCTPGKDKNGNPKVSERKHYFPRLTQIATHLVNHDAKGAGTYKELVGAINDSTAQITKALMGVEARIMQSGVKVEIAADEDLIEHNEAEVEAAPQGEGEGNEQSSAKQPKRKPAAASAAPKRRRRKKATTA